MHGGNLLEAMEKYGKDSFIDLSANINPFGPPEGVWQAIKEALPKIVHYPDPEYRRLRKVMSEQYDLPEEYILLGNGAGELLFAILQAIHPKNVLIPSPAFGEYERAAIACQAEVKRLILGHKGWASDCFPKKNEEDLIAFWTEKMKDTELLFLNTPHNPTSSVLEKSHFEIILKIAKSFNTTVVIDESFVDFLDDDKRFTGREYLLDYPNLIVLYSLTKFYSIPGLRLGAVFASPDILGKVMEHRDPWVVNILAEEAGMVALKDHDFPTRVRGLLLESKDYFIQAFAENNFSNYMLESSGVNFALLQIKTGQARDLVENLGRQGVLVRNCSNFIGLEGEFVRVAIKDIPSMEALIEGLRRCEDKVREND